MLFPTLAVFDKQKAALNFEAREVVHCICSAMSLRFLVLHIGSSYEEPIQAKSHIFANGSGDKKTFTIPF